MAKRSPENEIRELLASEPVREFVWAYEGAADQLESGLTLATLRYGGKYAPILPGEIISADCPHENRKVPLIVLMHKMGPVREHFLPLLACDGFLTHKQALTRLKQFYGQEVTGRSETHLLVFMAAEAFEKFPLEKQVSLIQAWSQPEATVLSTHRDIFFPSLAQWIAFHDGNAQDFHQFLLKHHLITQEQIDAFINAMGDIIRDSARQDLQEDIINRALNEGFGQLAGCGKKDNLVYSWTLFLRPLDHS